LGITIDGPSRRQATKESREAPFIARFLGIAGKTARALEI